MRPLTLAGSLLVIAAAPWCARAQDSPSIAIVNYAGVRPSLLRSAADTARLAFLSAHLKTRWRICEDAVCPDPAQEITGPALDVFILSKMPPSLAGKSGLMRGGYALPDLPHPRAYAFLDVVNVVSHRTTRSEDVVLACILIHEIGHLFGLPHQPQGAMRADLDSLNMDRIVRGQAFDSAQSRALRAALAAGKNRSLAIAAQ